MDQKAKNYQRGTGNLSQQNQQVGQVFYSFEQEEAKQVSGVVITQQHLTEAENSFLEDKEGQRLKLSALEAVSPAGKRVGFTALRLNG